MSMFAILFAYILCLFFLFFFFFFFFFFQAEDGIRDHCVTGVQTCALPISSIWRRGLVSRRTAEGKGGCDLRPRSRDRDGPRRDRPPNGQGASARGRGVDREDS